MLLLQYVKYHGVSYSLVRIVVRDVHRSHIRFRLLRPSSSLSSPSGPAAAYSAFDDLCAVLSTMLVPSLNFVLKRTLALVNKPSFNDTTINCDPLNRVRNSCPICCVCDRSSAASISSKIYIGAGLNCSSAIINESAISDLHTRFDLQRSKFL
jgi:hypothetical protein